MVGKLDKNLRSGHLAEDMGISVLRSFCAVARPPQSDDIGFDAIATLLHRCGRRLTTGGTFAVQFKTANVVEPVVYQGSALDWLLALEIPLFFGRVDPKAGTVAFHTIIRWGQLVLKKSLHRVAFEFETDDYSEFGHVDVDNTVAVGPPILTATMDESRTDAFAERAADVLSAWVELELRNIRLRKLGRAYVVRWRPNHRPDLKTVGVCHGVTGGDRDEHVALAVPYIEALELHIRGQRSTGAEGPAIVALAEWMRGVLAERLGPFDLDFTQ